MPAISPLSADGERELLGEPIIMMPSESVTMTGSLAKLAAAKTATAGDH
jgi:hypothetical protein